MVDYILCCKCSKRLYIFKGERIKDIYIEHCKVGTCMMMQRKAWMTFFYSKKIGCELFQTFQNNF